LIDYHLHVIAHGDRPMSVENILEYCEVAHERGICQTSPPSRRPAR
jgi:histidinol-phosphatase (PHP family)